jgi:parallel beta-helix repeat protein
METATRPLIDLRSRARHALLVIGLLAGLATFGAASATGAPQPAFLTIASGQSVQAALSQLAPGSTLYLSGSFTEDVTISKSGITLTSAPGQVATLRGRLIIWDGANDVVVSNLRLDGRNAANAPSPTVLGDRAVFRGNDVTNYNTEICFILGSLSRGYVAEGTVIDGNRIHNCGKLPPQNQDHGIYLEYARDTRIVNNYIYDNADRGIQLYPDADGTLVANNVIDGNGEGIIFSGSGSLASDRNTVRDNVIANSAVRYNVEYYYSSGGATGEGNVVTRNCLWNGAQGDIIGDGIAFTASDNIVADPLYLDRASKDFRLRAESPCRGKGPAGEPGPAVVAAETSGSGEPAPSLSSDLSSESASSQSQPSSSPSPSTESSPVSDPAPAPAPAPAPQPSASTTSSSSGSTTSSSSDTKSGTSSTSGRSSKPSTKKKRKLMTYV